MNDITENKAYQKLTPERKMLMDMVIQQLKNENGIWKQGWISYGAPESAITHKKYRGINNIFLTLVGMVRGYDDNRWLTYKQMDDRGWKFKTNEAGQSLGRKAGVPVEFYELYDRATNRPFDRSVLSGMDKDEQDEYIKDNVLPFRKTYKVFNASLIDGIPALEQHIIDPNGKSEKADKLIKYWDENESKIDYGGTIAAYNHKTDRIRCPNINAFENYQEYYATLLHEISHSTGHESRLNRDLSNTFGTEKYAIEELKAELGSIFLEQELGVKAEKSHIKNNAMYIKDWMKELTENPNALFEAIAEADRISKFVIARQQEKEVKRYAILQDTNELNEPVFKLYCSDREGQIKQLGTFKDREELTQGIETMKTMPDFVDKELVKVPYEELQRSDSENKQNSIEQGEFNPKQDEEEPSKIFVLPSVAAATKAAAVTEIASAHIDSLQMPDRDIVDEAMKTRSGDTFKKLYEGQHIFPRTESNARSLFARLAVHTQDVEQMMRIFKSSGQFSDSKEESYYKGLASEAIEFIKGQRTVRAGENMKPSNRTKLRYGANSKT